MAESLAVAHRSPADPLTLRPGREPTAIAAVRAWLTDTVLPPVPVTQTVAAEATLMASELVSNVISHTLGEPEVSVDHTGACLRVSVADDDPFVPAVRPVDPERIGGNGLRIVDALSDAWGVDSRRVGKAVWFEISCSARTAPAGVER